MKFWSVAYLEEINYDKSEKPTILLCKREKVEEVEMVEKRVASVDSFLDKGVPVKRLKTVEPVAYEVKAKDSLSDIHSLDELKLFLVAETKLRKTCLTRSLMQNDWLRAVMLKAVNEKTPNKSLKLCCRIFRSALSNHALLFQRR